MRGAVDAGVARERGEEGQQPLWWAATPSRRPFEARRGDQTRATHLADVNQNDLAAWGGRRGGGEVRRWSTRPCKARRGSQATAVARTTLQRRAQTAAGRVTTRRVHRCVEQALTAS